MNVLTRRHSSDLLNVLRDQGAKPDEIIGQLAASVGLVPMESRLSAQELLEELTIDSFKDKIRNACKQEIPAD